MLQQQEIFILCIIGWDEKISLKNYLVCVARMTVIPFSASEHVKEYLQMNLTISVAKALLRMKLSHYFYLSMFLYYTLRIYAHSGMVPSITHSAVNTTGHEQTQRVLFTRF